MSTVESARDHAVGLAAYSLRGGWPGVANLIGFAAGFPVSYSGHRWWTFDSTRAPHSEAVPRFLLVALSSFAANQALLLLAMHWLALPFWLVLGVVLLLVAGATYVLSRYWVFRS
jgi:putative flippase GtrA